MKRLSLVAMVIVSLLVVVALPGLVSAANANATAPSLTVISPNTSIPGQTLSVTIRGKNLAGATAISFGSEITTDNFSVTSDTEIVAGITIDGKAAIGARDISVVTPNGIAAKTDAFTVVSGLAPKLTSLSPAEGIQGETLTVTIAGTDLAGVTAISFGSGITTDNFIVDGNTQITANISIDSSAPTGASDVSVTNANGVGTKTGGFTVTQQPPDSTSDGGEETPFWVWIIVGASAAAVLIGIGATVYSRRQPAKPQ